MTSIFYDLETTDKLFVGQILNYAFLHVDDQYNVLSECCGKIRVTRLQLPSPEAILANKTDMMAHQAEAPHSEKEALLLIWNYLAKIASESKAPVRLVGYNSSRFDLPYLRTSFIRNGLNPYFEGKLVSADLLFVSRRVAGMHRDFPRAKMIKGEKLSLSLESLTKGFELLSGPQTHESREDVLLTIKLAELFATKYDLNVQTYSGYEIPEGLKRGDILWSGYPSYDPEASPLELTPRVLLDSDHRSSLWVNLDRFKRGEGRESISWYSRSASQFIVPPQENPINDELVTLGKSALSELSTINLKNYFSKSICDIEQDIYRLDFQSIEALRLALWERDPTKLHRLKNGDADTIYDRHRIAHYTWGAGKDEKVRSMLRDYAHYRYGGRMLVAKSHGKDSYEEGVYSPHYHETLSEMISRIPNAGEDARDRALMESLLEYYKSSDIYDTCGEELMSVERKKREKGEVTESSPHVG